MSEQLNTLRERILWVGERLTTFDMDAYLEAVEKIPPKALEIALEAFEDAGPNELRGWELPSIQYTKHDLGDISDGVTVFNEIREALGMDPADVEEFTGGGERSWLVWSHHVNDPLDQFLRGVDSAESALMAMDEVSRLGLLALRDRAAEPSRTEARAGSRPRPETGWTRGERLPPLPFLSAHADWVEQVVQGLLLQRWYQFLEDAYGALVLGDIEGRWSLKRRTVDVRNLDLDVVREQGLRPAVVQACRRSFESLSNLDKLSMLDRMLRERSTPVALDLDRDLVTHQKMHIVIRNMLQHHEGRMLEGRMRQVLQGSPDMEPCFMLKDEDGELAELRPGEHVALSKPEVLRLMETLRTLAHAVGRALW